MSFLKGLFQPNIEKLAQKNIKGLIKALSYEGDYRIREDAAKALTKIGIPAIEPLMSALKSKEKYAHSSIVDILASIGAPAVEHLVAVLKDGNGYVCALAAEALAYSDDARAVEALSRLGTLAVEPLIAELKDIYSGRLLRAITALEKIGDARAVEPLITYLQENASKVWGLSYASDAATALGKIGDARAVPPLITVLMDEKGSGRWAAAEALGKIGDARAVEPLLAVLKDKDKDLRKSAAEALAMIVDARAVEPLIAALKDWDEFVRSEATKALLKIGAPAVKPLIAALKHENNSARSGAAETLGKLGDAKAIGPLTVALKDKQSEVRKAAAEALDQLKWKPESIEISITYWVAQEDWERCITIGAPAIEPLAVALNDEYYMVRRAAARTLGNIKDERTIEPLIHALQDKDSEVRETAIWPLASLGGASVSEALVRAGQEWIDKGNEDTARKIEKALTSMGDQKGAQIILDALEQAEMKRDIAMLEKGISAMEARGVEAERKLKSQVGAMAALLKSSTRAKRLPVSLLKKLETVKDGEDGEREIHTDPHDSYFAVEAWYPVHVDCSEIRRQASQELARRI